MTAKEYVVEHYTYKAWTADPVDNYIKDLSLLEKIKFFEEFTALPYPKPEISNDIIVAIFKDIANANKS